MSLYVHIYLETLNTKHICHRNMIDYFQEATQCTVLPNYTNFYFWSVVLILPPSKGQGQKSCRGQMLSPNYFTCRVYHNTYIQTKLHLFLVSNFSVFVETDIQADKQTLLKNNICLHVWHAGNLNRVILILWL